MPELLLDVVVLGLVARVVRELLERVDVALVQQHEVAVLEHLVDEAVDQPRPGVGAGLSVLQELELLERLASERVQAQVQLQQDVLLALEVVVERRLGGTEPLGDVA